MENPFITHGYAGPDFFCDREEETLRLVSAIRNERNCTLISLRRIGKTGLIHHVFNKFKKDYDYVYVDVLATENLQDFTKLFAQAVVSQLEGNLTKSVKSIASIFRKIKPTFTLDPFSGVPSLELDIKTTAESERTLEDIVEYLRSRKRKTIIAIDEFQQISTYPEKKTEAILRSHIQRLTGTVFIFSGSQIHLLTSIFNDASKPFYQSTELMFISFINSSSYKEFIRKNFSSGKRHITDEALDFILAWTKSYTFYVQFFCNKLFSKNEKSIDLRSAHATSVDILKENEGFYYSYRNLLTTQQWELLKAIAKEEKVEKINQKAFLNRYHLGASSVQRSVKALADREMIVFHEGGYWVYDVFFLRWLQQLP